MPNLIIASGPVIVEDNKVLLDKHGPDKTWKFCGGRIEKEDKNLVEVAKREVMQEMGIKIEILDNKPFLFYTTKKTDDDEIDIILVHYLAKRIGEIKPGEVIRQWDWIDLDKLPDDLSENIIPTLKHFGFIQ